MKKRINVTRPSIPPFEEYAEEIKSVWESGMLTNFGPLEEKLKGQLEAFLGVKNLPLFANGHQALMAAIRTVALTGRRTVITTPFTFASTTEAITGAGLRPLFADVDPVTYTLDPEKAEALINEDTAAIVPVHVYGNVCDVEKFDEISRKYGIPVIYDAAHCFGVKINGKGAGVFGAASMFSFHATKAFNSVEGGGVAVADSELADRIKRYANYGLSGADCNLQGTNAKMTEFSAAMGICNLRHIGEVTLKRKAVCEIYGDVLTRGAGFDMTTGQCDLGFKLLPEQDGVEKNYAYFPVIFGSISKDGRAFVSDGGKTVERCIAALEAENVFPRRYFYPLTSEFSCMKEFNTSQTPVAKALSENALCLPLYADLEPEDAERIASTVRGCIS